MKHRHYQSQHQLVPSPEYVRTLLDFQEANTRRDALLAIEEISSRHALPTNQLMEDDTDELNFND